MSKSTTTFEVCDKLWIRTWVTEEVKTDNTYLVRHTQTVVPRGYAANSVSVQPKKKVAKKKAAAKKSKTRRTK